VLLWATIGSAQSQTNAAVDRQKEAFDKIWKFADWYKNDQNDVIQRLQFTGRFQYDYANVDADQGSHHEWNVRRFRAGAKAKLFRTITLHGEVETNPQERNPFYVRFTDLYLMWSKDAKLELTFGKQGVPFTMDGATSSKELLTIDRSNLANNMWFPQEYMTGVSAAGEVSNWVYHAGVYSAGRGNREFGEFDGGIFTLAVAGYNFAESLGLDDALVTANYVYQDPHVNNTFTRRLQHVVSGNLKLAAEKWGLRADGVNSGTFSKFELRRLSGMSADSNLYFDSSSLLKTLARVGERRGPRRNRGRARVWSCAMGTFWFSNRRGHRLTVTGKQKTS
jgi:phosphate-selective porin OprO/OprP